PRTVRGRDRTWKVSRNQFNCSDLLLSRLQRSRFAELRLINRHVRFDFVQHNRIASVQPRIGYAKRELDSVDVAIIGEVNLRGDAADWGSAVTPLTQKQTSLPIEIQRCEKVSRPVSLHDVDHVGLFRGHILLE